MAKTEKLGKLPVRKKTETAPALTGPFTEMDRLFARLMGRALGRHWPCPWDWEWPMEPGLEAGLPRVDKDDLAVSMSADTVTIRGKVEHQQRKEGGGRVLLPRDGARRAHAQHAPAGERGRCQGRATYRDGVVALTPPRLEAARRCRIPIEH